MWLMDAYMDLIIWYLPDGGIYGFQLCYDKERDERSLTWTHSESFTHTRIDSGETNPLHAKGTPLPVAGGQYDYEEVRQQFQKRAALIDPRLSAFVLSKLGAATLANLPECAGCGIFLKQDSGETGPLSEAELLECIIHVGLVAEQWVRFGEKREWHGISEFFPNQFPSKPRRKPDPI